MTRKKTHTEFINELKQVNPDIEVLGLYIKNDEKTEVRCKVCGHIWSARPINLLRHKGCPKCAKKKAADRYRKPQKTIAEEIKAILPDIELLGDYSNRHAKIKAHCLRCDHVWYPYPSNLLKGEGCPHCCHAGTSFVEQVILLVFRHLCHDMVLSRDTDTIGMELDVLIPSRNFAVEYGGWMWHRSKIKHDIKRIEVCKEHGIQLFVVFDQCKMRIHEYDEYENVLLFKEDLSLKKNRGLLLNLLKSMARKAGLFFNLQKTDLERIYDQARDNSKMITNEHFVAELRKKNPHIRTLEKYKGSNEKINVECTICGYNWPARASNLLLGVGCPNCAGNTQKTHDAFIAELQSINPNVQVLGYYSNSKTKIPVKCRKCGYQWMGLPSSLIKNYGCAKCARNIKKTHEEFLAEFEKLNSEVEVIGCYDGVDTGIECRCKKCNYIWFPTPYRLLKGSGCPKCAGMARKTHEEFLKELHELAPTIEVLGRYKNNRTKLDVRCSVCGTEWQPTPHSLLSGRNCPQCARIKRGRRKKT